MRPSRYNMCLTALLSICKRTTFCKKQLLHVCSIVDHTSTLAGEKGTVYRHNVCVFSVNSVVGAGYRVVMETLCMSELGCVLFGG